MKYPSLVWHKKDHTVVLATNSSAVDRHFEGVILCCDKKDKFFKAGYFSPVFLAANFEPYPYEMKIFNNKSGIAKII